MEANAKFAANKGFEYPLLCDTERAVCLAYGACESASDGAAKRISYVIDAEGRIEQVHSKVAAREHPEMLLATL